MEFGALCLHPSCYIIWKTSSFCNKHPESQLYTEISEFWDVQGTPGSNKVWDFLVYGSSKHSSKVVWSAPGRCSIEITKYWTRTQYVFLSFLQLITLLVIFFISIVLNIVYYYFPDRFLQSRYFCQIPPDSSVPELTWLFRMHFPISVNGNSVLLLRLSRPFYCQLYLVFIIHI